MSALTDIAGSGRKANDHRPWPRALVTRDGWVRAIQELVAARATLLGLWGDAGAVHMALIDEQATEIAVFSLECGDGKFPSVGAVHPPAIRLERAIRDLYGLEPVGLPDTRPWLDLGFWGVTHPLGSNRRTRKEKPAYAFLPVEGEGLHEIPVGPVHAGIIEPGHFRFTANGEAVVRLEERLGYVHKGIEGLMAGASLEQGAKLAGRTSGDSTVAYALAFAQAVEAALQVKVPPRALWLRALMAELERLANHFGDIGAICNDASFSLMYAQCGILREQTLRAAETCFRPQADDGSRGAGGRGRGSEARRHGEPARASGHCAPALPRADRDLRQHRLAPGPHRRHRLSLADLGARLRRRRLCRPRLGTGFRRAYGAPLSAL